MWIIINGGNIDIQFGELTDRLANSDVIQTLHLGYNNIDVEGCIAISEALKVNQTLQTLNLGYNNIDIEGCTAKH